MTRSVFILSLLIAMTFMTTVVVAQEFDAPQLDNSLIDGQEPEDVPPIESGQKEPFQKDVYPGPSHCNDECCPDPCRREFLIKSPRCDHYFKSHQHWQNCQNRLKKLSDGLAQRRGELKHSCYLKSLRGATAEYTHQWNRSQAQQRTWHGGYYHTDWGQPVALVVPPTAATQVQWGWGVGQTTTTPIYHQFSRPYPGPYKYTGSTSSGTQLRATPHWPSHTDQFGVYYIRAPW